MTSQITATQEDNDLLADILWFIKGRNSAFSDRNASDELGFRHQEAIRKFRESFNAIQELRRLAANEKEKARLTEHFATLIAKNDSEAKKQAKRARGDLVRLAKLVLAGEEREAKQLAESLGKVIGGIS